jgi:hypothetical protein
MKQKDVMMPTVTVWKPFWKEVHRAAAATAYLNKIKASPDIATVFWDVAQGNDLISRGVYSSWEIFRPHIHGVRNSVFDEFKMEHDAWQFVFDNMEVDSYPKSDGTPRVSIL